MEIRTLDLSDRAKTVDFTRQICNEFPLAALVNNAGILEKEAFDEMTLDAWDRTMAVTRSLTNVLGPRGVRVNAVTPGWVDSGILAEPYEAATLTPLDRNGSPEDIAKVVAFLLSSKAAFIKGASIVVDGGYTGVDYFMMKEDQSYGGTISSDGV